MRLIRDARTQALFGAALAAALSAGAGSAPLRAAEPRAAQRRAEMLSAGVDPMPVGTAKQVERAKRSRLQGS